MTQSKQTSRSNVPLLTGLALAGAAVTGVAVAGLAATAAFAFRRHLRRDERMPGRVVLITGGSRGLGLALAERFARADARLVLASRNPDELTAARDLLLTRGALERPEHAFLIPADVTDDVQAAQLVERTIAHFGRLDILINNAGIIEVGAFEDQPLDAYTRAMDTHFYAALHTITAAVPHMLAQAAQPDAPRPAIVNIASIGGKVAVPHLLPYVASKFALVGFSEGLHAELRPRGVRVTTVCPGLMRTGGEEHAHFLGQSDKEARWFQFSAKTPGISTSVAHAASKIFNAVLAGRAEITITPQAWLAARVHGMAPEIAQFAASLAHEYILPAPASSPSALPANAGSSAPHRGEQ